MNSSKPNSKIETRKAAFVGVLLFTLILICTQTRTSNQVIRTLQQQNQNKRDSCSQSKNKILYYYYSGEQVDYTLTTRAHCNAMGLIEMTTGEGNFNGYLDRIGPFFFFVSVGCAMLFCWALLWVCYFYPGCCCLYRPKENYIRIITFSFSIIALICCFGLAFGGQFVLHSFKKDLNGVDCSINSIYEDIMDGRLVYSPPKWVGLNSMTTTFTKLSEDLKTITNFEFNDNIAERDGDFMTKLSQLKCPNDSVPSTCDEKKNKIKQEYGETITPVVTALQTIGKITNDKDKIDDAIDNNLNTGPKELEKFKTGFTNFEENFLNPWNDYKKYIKGSGYIFLVIIYSFYLAFSLFGTVFLVSFGFLDGGKPVKIILHIIWNVLTLFCIFCFILGGLFGMLQKASKDVIGYVDYFFSQENLKSENPKLIPAESKDYIFDCLNVKKGVLGRLNLDEETATTNKEGLTQIQNLHRSIRQLYLYERKVSRLNQLSSLEENKNSFDNTELLEETFQELMTNLRENLQQGKDASSSFYSSFENLSDDSDIFSFADCSFLKIDLNIIYVTLSDISKSTEKLTVITLLIAFISIVGIVCMIVTIFRYDKERLAEIEKQEMTQLSENKNLLKNGGELDLIKNDKSDEIRREKTITPKVRYRKSMPTRTPKSPKSDSSFRSESSKTRNEVV